MNEIKRTITLMIYIEGDIFNTKIEDVDMVKDLKKFCADNKIYFEEKGVRGSKPIIYDFIIKGNTTTYNKLKEKYGENLKETYFAGLGNTLDINDDKLKDWENIVSRYREKSRKQSILYHDFAKLLVEIKDTDKLEYLYNYIFDDFSESLIASRISILKGAKCDCERYMDDVVKIDKTVQILKTAKDDKYDLTKNDICALIDILEKSIHL